MVRSPLVKTAFFIFLYLFCYTAHGKILEVGSNYQYTSIHTAIDSADYCDTIYVHKGTYRESHLLIDRPMTIIGRNQPVIDIEGKAEQGFVIQAEHVVIEGLKIVNGGTSYLTELAAIKLIRNKHTVIKNNIIENCHFGIYLEYAENVTVDNNLVRGDAQSEASAGNAIHIWKGQDITVENNRVTNHRDGIYFEFVTHSVIRKNYSYDNLRYGLHFMFSNDDDYINNIFESNGAGVAVMFSSRILMHENEFRKNWGSSSYGLLLKEISDAEILHNEFTDNTIGILAEGASKMDISRNTFRSNGKAMDIKGNCLDLTISENNFIGNTFEVITNSKYNRNSYSKNYWSQYKGYDLDRDGIGDVPYRPVSVYAKITSEIPAANILIHSLFVNLTELGERVFPTIIPEDLIDNSPKMKAYEFD